MSRYKLPKFKTKFLKRQNFFTNRVIDQWNGLPDYVVNVQTINEFKNKLDVLGRKWIWTPREVNGLLTLIIILVIIVIFFVHER